ncbi:MAG: hypothetical protein LUH03_10925 [Oscillospiraceae bacterium]|nr:hypothetical protein [Oscillospiraceae bacterium]
MLGINARVEDLRESLIKTINDAQMPACILDYVLTEILNDVRLKRMSAVQSERQKDREDKGIPTVPTVKTETVTVDLKGEPEDDDNSTGS